MIRNRLLAWIIPPIIVVYGILVFLDMKVGRDHAIQETERFLQETTARNAERINLLLNDVSNATHVYAMKLGLRPPESVGEIDRFLRRYLEQHPNLVGFHVAFEPGEFQENEEALSLSVVRENVGGELRSLNVGDSYDFTWWDWYLLPRLTGKRTWTDPFVSGVRKHAFLCAATTPILRDGRFVGVVSIDVDLNDIREIVRSIEPDGATYRLVNTTGTFISAPEPDIEMYHSLFSIGERAGSEEFLEVSRKIIAGESGAAVLDDPLDGNRIWLVYSPLKETGWSLLATIKEATITQPVYEQLRGKFLIFFAGLLLILGIIFTESTRITAPLRHLAAFARELSKGNLDASVPGKRGTGEIGQLADTFDNMTTQLRENIKSRIREETARKLVENELQVARRIQESLLPRGNSPLLRRAEYALFGVNEPAKFMAGDFYDFFLVDDHTLALVIADVSGKGVPAAMFMAVTRTLIRNFSLPGSSPKSVIQATNDALVIDNTDEMFVTLFYANYDLRSGCLTYVNAGHNPPYRISVDGRIEPLTATGPLLGVVEEARYEETTIQLVPDDLCVMFTDGVTDAYFPQEEFEQYGEHRLEKLLVDARDQSVESIVGKILLEVETFARGERIDDITLIVFRTKVSTTS